MANSRFSVRSILGFLIKTLFFLILLGIVLGGVWIYTCVFKFPEIPTDKMPDKIIELWDGVVDLQNTQCGELGYWFGKDATRNQKLIEQNMNPAEEGKESPVENLPVAEKDEQQCGTSGIEIDPSEGLLGDTYAIYLKGFVPNDAITACWFYPDGERINCAELDMNGDGYRETIFWSEMDYPPGEYSMSAQGECGTTEVSWMILEAE